MIVPAAAGEVEGTQVIAIPFAESASAVRAVGGRSSLLTVRWTKAGGFLGAPEYFGWRHTLYLVGLPGLLTAPT